MKNIKVILVAGGKGTRVSHLTGGVTPKSLVRLNRKVSKPLIAYQLQCLRKLGLKNIFVSLSEEWQIPMFKHSIRNGEFPPLNYLFGIHKQGHPLVVFRNKKVMNFIDASDFLLTYGDLFYSPQTFRELFNINKTNNTSSGCVMHSKNPRWKLKMKNQFIQFKKNKQNRIIGFGYGKKLNFSIHAPFLFQNRALKTIKKELRKNPPRTITLLLRLIKKNELSIIYPRLLLNMNIKKDVNKLEYVLAHSQL